MHVSHERCRGQEAGRLAFGQRSAPVVPDGGTHYITLSAVHDSSAKLPSGLLNGNVNQYGDIDQCLNVRSPWQGGVVKGRYCLTTSLIRVPDSDHPLLRQVHQLLQSHSLLRSELDDVSVPATAPRTSGIEPLTPPPPHMSLIFNLSTPKSVAVYVLQSVICI
jgi:hypothetical protein